MLTIGDKSAVTVHRGNKNLSERREHGQDIVLGQGGGFFSPPEGEAMHEAKVDLALKRRSSLRCPSPTSMAIVLEETETDINMERFEPQASSTC